MFFSLNVYAQNYTVDEVIEASKSNLAIKDAVAAGKKVDPDFKIELVKSSDGGIDIVYKDSKEHVDFIKETNTLEIKYQPSVGEIEYSEASFKLTNFSLIQDCVLQLSPYYDKIIQYKNELLIPLEENSPHSSAND